MGSQDKADGDRERLEIHISILSLRGANKVRDAAIHCMQCARTDHAVRSLAHSGSPRAFALAMTRWGVMGVCGSVTTRFCHCEERAERGTWQSTVCNGHVRTIPYGSRFTVDRHGLSPSR